MLKRTSLHIVNKILEENKNWKILDIGCGYTANRNANTIADVQDLSKFYKDRNFVKIENNTLEKVIPIRDREKARQSYGYPGRSRMIAQ